MLTLKCSFCGRPSKNNPGPLCARKLLQGSISHSTVNSILYGVNSGAIKNFTWHDDPDTFYEKVSKYPDSSVQRILTVIDFEDICSIFKSSKKILHKASLAMNSKAREIPKDLILSSKEIVRCAYFGSQKLSDNEFLYGLTEKSDRVFYSTVNNVNLTSRSASAAVLNSSISHQRKSILISSGKCDDSVIIDLLNKKIFWALKAASNIKVRRSKELNSAILKNINSHDLLKSALENEFLNEKEVSLFKTKLKKNA